MKDSSPLCSPMIVSSDHWGLNVVQLCGMILRIALFVANGFFPLSCSFFAAETVMDTRVATAELGWTAYPNSGVSETHSGLKKKKGLKFCFQPFPS